MHLESCKNLPKNRNGFSIVEILITVVIIGTILVGVVSALYMANIASLQIYHKTIAVKAAEEEMELIRDLPFDNILTSSSSFTTSDFSSLINPVGTLTIDNPYGTDDMRRITVGVSSTLPNGRVLNTSLVTLVTRAGINQQ